MTTTPSTASQAPAVRQAPPDWDYEKQGGYLLGYADCRCVLSHYCDGKCRPIFEYCAPPPQPSGTDGLPG